MYDLNLDGIDADGYEDTMLFEFDGLLELTTFVLDHYPSAVAVRRSGYCQNGMNGEIPIYIFKDRYAYFSFSRDPDMHQCPDDDHIHDGWVGHLNVSSIVESIKVEHSFLSNWTRQRPLDDPVR